jgi:hypothetical protein
MHLSVRADGDVTTGDEALPAYLSDNEESTGDEDANEPTAIAAE